MTMPEQPNTSSSAGVTVEQFQQLLAELKRMREEVDQKIDKLREDVTLGQQDATDKVVKKLASERGYVFKRKGHEQQFRFNTEVEDRIQKAQSEAAKVQPATEKDAKVLEKLQAELKEGTQAIAYRQK